MAVLMAAGGIQEPEPEHATCCPNHSQIHHSLNMPVLLEHISAGQPPWVLPVAGILQLSVSGSRQAALMLPGDWSPWPLC